MSLSHSNRSLSDLALAPRGKIKLVRTAAIDFTRGFATPWTSDILPEVAHAVRAFDIAVPSNSHRWSGAFKGYHVPDRLATSVLIGSDSGAVLHSTRYGEPGNPSRLRLPQGIFGSGTVTAMAVNPLVPNILVIGSSEGSVLWVVLQRHISHISLLWLRIVYLTWQSRDPFMSGWIAAVIQLLSFVGVQQGLLLFLYSIVFVTCTAGIC